MDKIVGSDRTRIPPVVKRAGQEVYIVQGLPVAGIDGDWWKE
jgi:hypothetical protein